MYTTADGEASDGTGLNNEYWWSNVSCPVYFAKAMKAILQEGYTKFIEVGPHPVLANSVNELAYELDMEIVISPSLRRNEPELPRMLHSFGDLYCTGYEIDWTAYYSGAFRYVKLPHYAWEHEKFWKESREHMDRRLGRKAHVFIGYRTDSFVPQWETEVNDHILPFVKDHCVNGQVLLRNNFV